MRNGGPGPRGARGVAAAALALLALSVGSAASAQAWEMRVCADPDALPFSHRDGTGFENRIAEVLAEELGARLTYVWWPQGSTLISQQLREGTCDLIMGIPDGYEGLLNTLAYYRSPYVFVYRADGPFEIGSLDDPALADLEIGVQSGGIPPHDALVERGLGGNVTFDPGRHVPLGSVIEAVASGEVDVGLAWGPVAAHFAARQPVELEIVPVTPAFEPPQRFMVLPMTIGLRPGDEAFRDRLSAALASRWDEIRGILASYDVPLEELPQPAPPPGASGDAARIGVVLPTRTGSTLVTSSLYDVVGGAARMGALLAESDLDARTGAGAPLPDVLPASAPSAEAAVRAAERLLATEDVAGVVGGVGEGQAEALAAWAEEARVPFLNVGSPDPDLRLRCDRHAFHVEASASMYLGALVTRFADQGHERLFVVRPEGQEGADLARIARERVQDRASARIVGSATVAAGQPTYAAELAAAREAGADAILLLLDPRDQIVFLAQAAGAASDLAVAAYPHPVTQTRDYLAAARLRVGGTEADERIALWDATLEAHGAGELNERYASRWGQPMDPSAWAAYEAVRLLYDAIAATDGSADAVVEHLEEPDLDAELAKGPDVSFGADHQLRQPLYVVQVDPDAEWGPSATAATELADVVGEIPPARGDETDPSAPGPVPEGGHGASCAR